MTSPALVCRNATGGYGSKIAFERIDFSLPQGAALAIVGPNGAGKTTFLRALVGLVAVTDGSVEVLGGTAQQHCRQVAYVQQTANIDADFPVSVLDVVVMARYGHRRWWQPLGKAQRAIAMSALEQMGIADRYRHSFGQLSGGQRQRVMLARAIAQQAQIVLLDEPFNGVDVTTIETSSRVLQELRAAGVTIVMSTHDLQAASSMCDHVLLMNVQQYGFGAPAEVLVAERLRQAFGGASLGSDGDHWVVTTG